jgi:23S rRNA pseudouridine955/2504/2580 synthase
LTSKKIWPTGIPLSVQTSIPTEIAKPASLKRLAHRYEIRGHRPHRQPIVRALICFYSSTWTKPLVKDIIEPEPSTHSPQVQNLQVDDESAGQRLDNFLVRHLKGAPKSLIYRIIRSGEVRVNKGRASVDTRLEPGDSVRVPPLRLSSPKSISDQAPAREFPLLFEDDSLMAIDKPAGVAVHGGSGVSFGVIEQLRRARPSARLLELVHRLDRETSGVLLVAKKRSALKNLQDQFRERETGKTYLALVQGQWPSNRKVIDLPLEKFLIAKGESEGERRVRVVAKDDPNGMRAITLVKVARLIGSCTLLEVTIKTGRTHQIRVHLASLGHPILGDDKYGDFEHNRQWQKLGLKRMFLHAWRLQFRHPVSGENMRLMSELPPELQQFIQTLQPGEPVAPL